MKMHKQERQYDCFLACIANTIQKPITEIFPEDFIIHIEEGEGTHSYDIKTALEHANLSENTDYFRIRVSGGYDTVRELLQGRRAILQVPSLNHKGKCHMVYWSGETLYDPSLKQTYSWLCQCFPIYIWIFNEV